MLRNNSTKGNFLAKLEPHVWIFENIADLIIWLWVYHGQHDYNNKTLSKEHFHKNCYIIFGCYNVTHMFLIGRFAAQQYSFRLVKNKSMILTSLCFILTNLIFQKFFISVAQTMPIDKFAFEKAFPLNNFKNTQEVYQI